MSTQHVYQIKIKGHLDRCWSEWFGDLTISHEPSGKSLLTGPVVDQAALLGMLLKIHDLNLTLLSLQLLEPATASFETDSTSDDDLMPETP